MSEVIINKPHYLNRLHESLPRAGGSAADYAVSGGGYDPNTGNPRPNYLHVVTEVVDQATLNAVISAHNSLGISSDKSSILADDADTVTITCVDPAIAGDSSVDYTVWLDGAVYTATNSAPVTGGQVQFTLKTEVPGNYLVGIERQGEGNFESGYIQINAQEVS